MVIAQRPNMRLLLARGLLASTKLLPSRWTQFARRAGRASFIAWSGDELVRGEGPIRRLIGAAGLAAVAIPAHTHPGHQRRHVSPRR